MNISASPPGGGAPSTAVQLWSGYVAALKWLAGASTLVLVVIMVVQVLARYVVGSSIIWAEELCRYILIWQTFLLIGLAFQQGELVALDILSTSLSRGKLLALRIIVLLPVFLFLWLMVVNGWAYASRFTGQRIPALDFIWQSLTGHPANISIFWIYVAVPVGCGLLLAHLIGRYAYDLWLFLTGRPEPHHSLPAAHSSEPRADEAQP